MYAQHRSFPAVCTCFNAARGFVGGASPFLASFVPVGSKGAFGKSSVFGADTNTKTNAFVFIGLLS